MRTVLLCLLAYSSALFAAQPAAVDSTQWSKLVKLAVEKGEAADMQDGSVWYSLARLTPNDRLVSHTAEYFTVIVAPTSNGAQAIGVSEVSEEWKLEADGNWHVDQWIFLATTNGLLYKAYHGNLVEQKNGIVLQSALDQLEKTDATAAAKFSSNWVAWAAYSDSNSLARAQ